VTTTDQINEGLREARKAITKLVDLYFDNVPVDELEREQIVETIHEGLSDEFDRLYRIEATVDRVRVELDRLAALDTVTDDDGRANTFATGARWVIRMVRENALAEPGQDQPGPQCTAGLLPATDEAVDRCVRHGEHDTHVTAAGARWPA